MRILSALLFVLLCNTSSAEVYSYNKGDSTPPQVQAVIYNDPVLTDTGLIGIRHTSVTPDTLYVIYPAALSDTDEARIDVIINGE